MLICKMAQIKISDNSSARSVLWATSFLLSLFYLYFVNKNEMCFFKNLGKIQLIKRAFYLLEDFLNMCNGTCVSGHDKWNRTSL